MIKIIQSSQLSIKNGFFQFDEKNVLVESGLAKNDVKESIQESAITHLEIEELNNPIQKKQITYHYKLLNIIAYPADYRKFYEQTRGTKSWDINCSNYSLALDKFGRNVGSKFDYISHSGQNNLQFNPKGRFEEGYVLAKVKQKQLVAHYDDRNKGIMVQVQLIQNWRMVLNLGATTAYNNGFLLHKIYGVPYLPGQAIKGVLRHYVIATYFESNEKKAWQNESYRLLFGNEEVESDEKDGDEKNKVIRASQGKAIFFDVFPTNDNFTIEADIMNPHNTKYYEPSNLSQYPNDTTNPVPIKFLTLKDASFNITVFVPKEYKEKKIDFPDSNEWNSPQNALKQLLSEAMEFQGIGAKTNLGYGRLNPKQRKKSKLKN